MNDGESIYPIYQKCVSLEYDSEKTTFYPEGGMSVRDYFAAKALQGLICWTAIKYPNTGPTEGDQAVFAESAYKFADAMIAQRDKK